MYSLTTSSTIDQIIVLLRPSCKGMTRSQVYTDIARRLSTLASKNPPWSWRYVQGIEAMTIEPSPHIDQAIHSLLAFLTNTEPAQIYSPSETVQLQALTGTIIPGAWVLSKSLSCAHPACTINFIPRVPWQKYCPLHKRR